MQVGEFCEDIEKILGENTSLASGKIVEHIVRAKQDVLRLKLNDGSEFDIAIEQVRRPT